MHEREGEWRENSKKLKLLRARPNPITHEFTLPQKRRRKPLKLGYMLRILVPREKHSYANSNNVQLSSHLSHHPP